MDIEQSEEIKKAIDITNKVESILGKTRHKLKLETRSVDQKYNIILRRFNQQISQFRTLSTFVDTKSKLNKLNIMNNDDLFQRVKSYLIKRKLSKQLQSDHDNMDHILKHLEREFEHEDHHHESDVLDFGESHYAPQTMRFQPKTHLINFQRSARNSSLPGIEMPISNNAAKSQYDQNLFYYQVEESLQQQEQKKIENQLKEKRIRDEEQKKLDEQEQEIIQLCRNYGIDLNNDQCLEEHIYKSFKQKANQLIHNRLNDVKAVHKAHLNKEIHKLHSIIPKIKLSTQWEHKMYGTPLTLQQPLKVERLPMAFSRKRSMMHEIHTNKRNVTVYKSQLNLLTQSIVQKCDTVTQKEEHNELVKEMQQMESCIDEVVQRANFQEKLQILGFSQEEQFFIKKYLRQPGSMQKILRKKQEKSSRLFKFDNM